MSEDLRLIAECLDGVPEAFAELVRRYEDRLSGLVYRLLQNSEDARDVVQDSFLQAYASLERFQGHSDFYTWLYRIAVNAAIDFKRKRRGAVSMDGLLPDGQRIDFADPSPESGPSGRMEAEEELRQLYQALSRLPAKDRMLLVLRDIEGRKYEELVKRLNIPLGTISSRLHRARSKLRKLLGAREDPVGEATR